MSVWWQKIAFKISFELYFHPSIIEFKIEEETHTKAFVDMSSGTGDRIFLFSWERLGGSLREYKGFEREI